MPPLHMPAYPRQEFGSSNTPALAGDVFRFAIWLFFSFLTFSVGRIHPYIHSYTVRLDRGQVLVSDPSSQHRAPETMVNFKW